MFTRINLREALVALENEITVFVFNGEVEVFSEESHGEIDDYSSIYVSSDDINQLKQLINN